MRPEDKIKMSLRKAKKDPVFFFEHFCNDVTGEKYKLEPQQKAFLTDPSQYRILFFSRRSGKSLVLIADILHKAFFNPNQSIVIVSPTLEQARTIANTFNDLIARSPLLQPSFTTQNKLDKQLDNNTRIKFATAGAQSGQKQNSSLVGSSVHHLYLDETQALDKEAMATIIPIISGQRGDPTITYAGTPRGRTGFFYDAILNSKSITEVYNNNGKPRPCPKKGDYSLHKFKITDVDEKDNVLFSRSEYRLTVPELETIKHTIGVEMFKREFCLDFVDDISIPYYNELRRMAGVLKPPEIFSDHRITCCGIDFGKRRNNSVLSIGCLNEVTNTWEIQYFKTWELGTSYKTITHYLNNILPRKFPNLVSLAIDATGVGQAISEQVISDSYYNVYDIIFSQPMKVSLNENAINNLESRFVTYYPHEQLEKEMQEYTREITENDRIVYKKGVADDFIDSFILCNYAITKYIQDGPKRQNPFFVGSMNDSILTNTSYRQNLRNRRWRRE